MLILNSTSPYTQAECVYNYNIPLSIKSYIEYCWLMDVIDTFMCPLLDKCQVPSEIGTVSIQRTNKLIPYQGLFQHIVSGGANR